MLPKWHIILGLIFSILCLIVFPKIGLIGFSIIFLSSFLIDVDHYMFYVFTKKDISLKRAHKWFIKGHKKFQTLSYKEKVKHLKKRGPWPMIFHGIEAILILIILSFFHEFFLFILIGFIFHQLLDLIHITIGGYTLTHIGSQTYNTIIYMRKN